MYGGYPVYVLGLIWLAIWSIIGGFSANEIMLNFCRALAGLGPAAFLPSSIMILGSIYRPGPRKNLVFSIYGACAPLGFFIGIFFAGLTGLVFFFLRPQEAVALSAMSIALPGIAAFAAGVTLRLRSPRVAAAIGLAGLLLATWLASSGTFIASALHSGPGSQPLSVYIAGLIDALVLLIGWLVADRRQRARTTAAA